MSILEQIKSELPWLDDKVSFDLTRGKPSADQLNVTQKNFKHIEMGSRVEQNDKKSRIFGYKVSVMLKRFSVSL